MSGFEFFEFGMFSYLSCLAYGRPSIRFHLYAFKENTPIDEYGYDSSDYCCDPILYVDAFYEGRNNPYFKGIEHPYCIAIGVIALVKRT